MEAEKEYYIGARWSDMYFYVVCVIGNEDSDEPFQVTRATYALKDIPDSIKTRLVEISKLSDGTLYTKKVLARNAAKSNFLRKCRRKEYEPVSDTSMIPDQLTAKIQEQLGIEDTTEEDYGIKLKENQFLVEFDLDIPGQFDMGIPYLAEDIKGVITLENKFGEPCILFDGVPHKVIAKHNQPELLKVT